MNEEKILSVHKNEKIVRGAAKVKKKNKILKFADIFLAEDIDSVKEYIVTDVVIPAVKNAISDTVDAFLFNGSKDRRRSTASKVSYGRDFDDRERRVKEDRSRRAKGYEYDEIIFNTRGDAEAVLDRMNDMLDQFSIVSVGDLYDMADISTDNYTVNKYGWKDIQSANVVRVRDGYIIKLPKPMPID